MEEPYSGIKAALADLCQQMLALRGLEDVPSSASTASPPDNQTEGPRRFSDLQNLFTQEFSAIEIQALSEAKSKAQRAPSISSNIFESEDFSKTGTQVGYREQSERLKFVLQKFMQLSCQFCQVVMVIDDLQWGDKPSMDLLKSWMLMDASESRTDSGTGATDTSVENQPLLIMGCFRSEASEHSVILQVTIEELQSAQES